MDCDDIAERDPSHAKDVAFRVKVLESHGEDLLGDSGCDNNRQLVPLLHFLSIEKLVMN